MDIVFDDSVVHRLHGPRAVCQLGNDIRIDVQQNGIRATAQILVQRILGSTQHSAHKDRICTSHTPMTHTRTLACQFLLEKCLRGREIRRNGLAQIGRLDFHFLIGLWTRHERGCVAKPQG